MYYILLPDEPTRVRLLLDSSPKAFTAYSTTFRSISSPMGRKVGRISGPMNVTDDISERLLRLPLLIGQEFAPQVAKAVREALGKP